MSVYLSPLKKRLSRVPADIRICGRAVIDIWVCKTKFVRGQNAYFRRTTGATPARQSSETAWPNLLEQAGTSSSAPAILDSSKN